MNICPVCEKEARYIYCSLSCSNKSRLAKNEAKYLKNPKPCKGCAGFVPYTGRQHNSFCSQSCAAVFNNKRREKKQRKCNLCNRLLSLKGRSRRCRVCFKSHYLKLFGERTLGSFKSTQARHRYQKIRSHAHRVADQGGLVKRCFCGYEKHVELAHKIAIGSFSKDSKISEVNSADNLIYLCPNHHWELDSGSLVLTS
jgi:predicted restriction endonuclease